VGVFFLDPPPFPLCLSEGENPFGFLDRFFCSLPAFIKWGGVKVNGNLPVYGCLLWLQALVLLRLDHPCRTNLLEC